MGKVEIAIVSKVSTGEELLTPAQGKPFLVGDIDSDGIVLLFGVKRARTRFSWTVLEGILPEFRHRDWTVIGGSFDIDGMSGTLDSYLKKHIYRNTASWVAALMEKAEIFELDRSIPCRFRVL